MVAVREARRAFRRYQTQCFWSYRKDLEIGAGDVAWVAGELMKHGNREAWLKGKSLSWRDPRLRRREQPGLSPEPCNNTG